MESELGPLRGKTVALIDEDGHEVDRRRIVEVSSHAAPATGSMLDPALP